MPTYQYKVRDKAGKVQSGLMDAADGKELRKKLDANGLFIIDYTEKKSAMGGGFSFPMPFAKKVTLTELSIMSWQLYTMLNSGLTLVNSLHIIEHQVENVKLKKAVRDIAIRVKEGNSFSESLKPHNKVFPRLFIQMVYAGEVGGVLDEMLRRLAVYYEGQSEVSNRIKSAMMYPVILLIVSISVIIFMVVFVLPKFSSIFEEIGAEIPFSTQALLNFGELLRNYWYLFILAFIGMVMAYKFYVSTRAGRFSVDKIKLSLPGIGMLIKKTTASQFTQTLSTLISSGIPMLTALDVVTDTLSNLVVVKALNDVSKRVSEGKPVAEPLGQTNVFPEMVVSMIKVGEETGALDKILEKVADFYNKEVDNAIKTFTKIIEPVLIVFMTVVIGFITVSIFMPLTDIMQGMHM